SIQEIKDKARTRAATLTRNISYVTRLGSAETQCVEATKYEAKGELKAALYHYTIAGVLVQTVLASPELEDPMEQAHDAETYGFLSLRCPLRAYELCSTPRMSIQDRIKVLRTNGLPGAVSNKSPRSRELPKPPTSPPSVYTNILPPLHPLSASSSNGPSSPVSTSSHIFVPTSSLGPPSPKSTPSPPANVVEFNQAFPSIDELDGLILPSVPTGLSHVSTESRETRNDSPSSLRTFALPPDRPSSTPIPPTTYISRPASPTKPPIPRKPSNLSIASPGSPKVPGSPTVPRGNTITPKELAPLLSHTSFRVLLIDVRVRGDFEREHFDNGVICIEPFVLLRPDMTLDKLEDSMSAAPSVEQSLFKNRHKFNLVVMYNQSSTSFPPSRLAAGSSDEPAHALARLTMFIYERAITKPLQKPPMMLVGGIDAWRKEFGNSKLVANRSGDVTTKTHMGTDLSGNGEISGALKVNGAVNGSPPSDVLSTLPTIPFSTSASPLTSRHSPGSASLSLPLSSLPRWTGATSRSTLNGTRSNDLPSLSLPSSPAIGNGVSSIAYPNFSRHMSPTVSGPGSSQFDTIASPPQASINPTLTGRRSDYIDQSQEALSNVAKAQETLATKYTSYHQEAIAPLPIARVHSNATGVVPAKYIDIPRIASQYPVTYWGDYAISLTGLKNMGNTCYMNAPMQCLSATVPFARFFTELKYKNAINLHNPLNSRGVVTHNFARLLHSMWAGTESSLVPEEFLAAIRRYNPQYHGKDQHDSQEFLNFLLDMIHEDLNRIVGKIRYERTPEEEAQLERLHPQIASEREWQAWRTRNDSIIVDFFQGQLRNRLQCDTCHQTSTTYNVFSTLQLPVPPSKSGAATLQKCLGLFFNTEVLEKDDAWDCPKCKTKRRATKRLSLARLPPVLLISLKRFEAHGRFSDKIDTRVDFPLKNLDLSAYMPDQLSVDADRSLVNGGQSLPLDDPRTQNAPYKYDLYGVTNHVGNLSSGHYTAFVASRGQWNYCDDSTIKQVDPKEVVSQKAYVLFYKRIKA
ncbi:cysteine proteinase, partial [Fistulina hepatica ATCC 64428]